MRCLHLVHCPAPAQDPGVWLNNPIRRLSIGQQWYKPPHPSYENAAGLGAEKSLLARSPPHRCKEIKQLHVCSGKVDLDTRHPEGYCY